MKKGTYCNTELRMDVRGRTKLRFSFKEEIKLEEIQFKEG